MIDEPGTFIVIYPGGDRSKIDVADITGTEYERRDYDCASVKTFVRHEEAVDYGKKLAKEHGLQWAGEGGGAELDRDDEELDPPEEEI